MSIVFVFLDGVGFGKNDPETNPWATVKQDSLIAVEGRGPSREGAVWKPLDACLGVDGLPQSATGTTALFTGVNAPAELGHHLSGFPNAELIEIINRASIHKQAAERGIRSTFANAYNEAYFKRPLSRQSVTTHAVRAAGQAFRMMDQYRAGEAVFHDLTGELILRQGNGDKLSPPGSVVPKDVIERRSELVLRHAKKYMGDGDTFAELLDDADIPIISPEEGGRRIARLARRHDITSFEYVKTDMMGHSRNREWALAIVDEVMRFLGEILDHLDSARNTLIIASDHGNSEDLTVKSHTRNPVPTVGVGPLAERILSRCERISDLTPAILDAQ